MSPLVPDTDSSGRRPSRRNNRSISLFVSSFIPSLERMHHPYLQSNLCDIQVLRDFRKRLLRFGCRPTTFINQNLCDSLAEVRLYPRQTATRRRFVYTQNRTRLTQTQVVEVVEFY